MDFIKMLHARRSCRKFEARPVERALIKELLAATLTAPSSKNCRSTRLAVVEERAKLEKIAAMRSRGTAFVAEAPLAIIVMGDQTLTDLWVDNCAISATTLQYAAESVGLGSCWAHVNGRPHNDDHPEAGSAEDYLKSILAIPKAWRILCVVAIGYPAEAAQPHAAQDDADKVLFL